jgi:hypothetical protein
MAPRLLSDKLMLGLSDFFNIFELFREYIHLYITEKVKKSITSHAM